MYLSLPGRLKPPLRHGEGRLKPPLRRLAPCRRGDFSRPGVDSCHVHGRASLPLTLRFTMSFSNSKVSGRRVSLLRLLKKIERLPQSKKMGTVFLRSTHVYRWHELQRDCPHFLSNRIHKLGISGTQHTMPLAITDLLLMPL